MFWAQQGRRVGLSAGLLLLLAPTGSAQAAYTLASKWGFHDPRGITIAAGTLFIADFQGDRVAPFTDAGTQSGPVWHTVHQPEDVAVSGSVGFAPQGAAHGFTIQVFDVGTGNATGAIGPDGSGEGQLSGPSSVALNGDGTVLYVADEDNNRIDMFSVDGNWLGGWDGSGSGRTRFDGPEGVAVAPNGEVYVADTGHQRIEVFTPSGGFIRQWTVTPQGITGSNPREVAVDSHGFVYVADDGGSDRVLKFTADGAPLETIGSGVVDEPTDMAIDAQDNVYVTNYGNSQVQKWAFVKRAPGSLIAPEIRGRPRVRGSISCVPGKWTGSLPIAFAYAWLRNGHPVPGATRARFALKPADRNKRLTCEVTAKNAYGTARKRSKPTRRVT